MKRPILYLLLLLSIFSCKNNRDKQIEDKLYAEVMAIHDEVMPKMDHIMQLKGKLKDKIDSSKVRSAGEKDTLQQIITNLDESDEAMMQWMREFNVKKTGTHDEWMEYLMKEKAKIGQVRVKMLTSINKAEQVLKSK